MTEAKKGIKWENADLEGKHREWGEPIGGQGHLGDYQGYHKEQTTGNRKHDKIKRENTFIFEKDSVNADHREYQGYHREVTTRNRQNENKKRENTLFQNKEISSNSYSCPDLHGQFELFSKFGESGSSGSKITLSQSDRWLRQAKVIDGWSVTTIDTAIAFRKISRGSIWLEFKLWR